MNTDFVLLYDFAVYSLRYGQKYANSPKFQYGISLNVMKGNVFNFAVRNQQQISHNSVIKPNQKLQPAVLWSNHVRNFEFMESVTGSDVTKLMLGN